MAKVKVINRRQGSDLIGANFRNVASETVFTFGRFTVDTNFAVRTIRNYSNELSSFVKPITLQSLNVNEVDSANIFTSTQEVILNIDKSDLTAYARLGSLYEILRVSIENIILQFPASVYITFQTSSFTNLMSVTNYFYDVTKDSATFTIPFPAVINKFGIIMNQGNNQLPQGDPLRNLNLAYGEYLIWREENPSGNTHTLLGFTGYTQTLPYINVIVTGNPFPELSGSTQGQFNYHIKPQPVHFNKFIQNLSTLESYILNQKIPKGYQTEFQTPTQLEDGSVIYNNQIIIWPAGDGYNVDFSGYDYDVFLTLIGNIGTLFDQFKSDLIARMLVPQSMIENDLTDDGKVEQLLRIYGKTFDNIKVFIDALVTINKLSYNKKKNIPDILVKNFARTLGWDVTTLVADDNLLNSFFSIEDKQPSDLLPPEVDTELWRRILINTNYLFKTKGTREAIRTMLLMVGIPSPFINITEYVYTVKGIINPNTVTVSLADLPSASLPYNTSGYPIAPVETKSFYFQISGSTDSGQAYMDNFRKVGFNLNRTIDNRKSWVQAGAVNRIDPSTPTYFQRDSKLVINTKEIDVTLDIAQGIEYDVFTYNVANNFPISSSGVTKPYLYINIPFTYGSSANIFSVPEIPQGDIQVSFNGITLTKGNSPSDTVADYYINPLNIKEAILLNGAAQSYTNGFKDVITLTYVKDQSTGGTYTTVDYIVTKISSTPDGMTIPLIDTPLGEIQLVVNGITMTKSGSLFTGDYIVNPANSQEILIVNNALKNYLINNPIVVISYIKSSTPEPILKKSEVYRVDSFSASKFYYNAGISKYVYVLDYEPPDVKAIKIVINGLTLQNGSDFVLNGSNRKQVLLNTSSIGIGYIINAFYVTGDGTNDSAINFGNITLPNFSQISFLQYLDLINSRLINVKNRKTLTDHEGGIYPTVEKIYEEYLKRAFANPPLTPSHGYIFGNVYPFINKFNSFFHRFIDQLLSATIILKKGGVLIRNTAFTKQKFTYRRGVNFDSVLMYLGDDGSEFRKRIPTTTNSFDWSGLTCVYVVAPTTTTLAPILTTLKLTLISGNVLQDNTWSVNRNSGGSEYVIATQHPQGPYLPQAVSTSLTIPVNNTSVVVEYGKLSNGSNTQYGGTIVFKKNSVTITTIPFNLGANIPLNISNIYTFVNVNGSDLLEVVVNENIPATTTTLPPPTTTTTTTTAAPTTTTTTTAAPLNPIGISWTTLNPPYNVGVVAGTTITLYKIITTFNGAPGEIFTFKVDDSFFGFGSPTIYWTTNYTDANANTNPLVGTYVQVLDQGTFNITSPPSGQINILVKMTQTPKSAGSSFSVRWSLISTNLRGAIASTYVDFSA